MKKFIILFLCFFITGAYDNKRSYKEELLNTIRKYDSSVYNDASMTTIEKNHLLVNRITLKVMKIKKGFVFDYRTVDGVRKRMFVDNSGKRYFTIVFSTVDYPDENYVVYWSEDNGCKEKSRHFSWITVWR